MYSSALDVSLRFTPTCVGNTRGGLLPPAPFTVHPHLRGEHRVGVHELDNLGRFTPTCVGNTAAATAASVSISVHPHLRGEHAFAADADSRAIGSPPPAWGTRIRR